MVSKFAIVKVFQQTVRGYLGLALLSGHLLIAQQRTHIYVETITNKGGDIDLRDALIRVMKKQKMIAVAENAGLADYVVGGFGETFVKGYVGRNYRVRYKNSDSRPVYGGYLSVELKDKNDETVWSNLVTPSRIGAQDIAKDLADQIVERLMEFLSGLPGGQKQ